MRPLLLALAWALGAPAGAVPDANAPTIHTFATLQALSEAHARLERNFLIAGGIVALALMGFLFFAVAASGALLGKDGILTRILARLDEIKALLKEREKEKV